MSGLAYYNEIDEYAAQWLRNLIDAGHIAPGIVDTRSIEDVYPSDLKGFTQCHFFAGIGVWSLALRRAGWPDDRPVWTGSCPCQPFSAAGKGAGTADERHLWPAWHHLIRECRPVAIRGEQVASADALAWLDLVHADLEAAGYACGAVDLCAAGVGAPHIRQRLWIVADATNERQHGRRASKTSNGRDAAWVEPERLCDGGRVADTDGERRGEAWNGGLPGRETERAERDSGDHRPSPVNSFWRTADWLLCRDGKWRPVEPGTFPLAHGAPARVGRLRAYGNAIVPQVAAEVISAFMECRP